MNSPPLLQDGVRLVPVNPYTFKIIQDTIREAIQKDGGIMPMFTNNPGNLKIIDPPYQAVQMPMINHDPITFEIVKYRSPEFHTIGGSYATDGVGFWVGLSRTDNTDYRMRALGFRAFLAGRAPRC